MSHIPVPPPNTAAEVDERCRTAGRAAPALAALPPADRAALLDRLADTLRSHEQEIVTLADTETSLGRARLTGELHRTAGQLELFAGALRDGGVLDVIIDAPDPAAQPAPRPGLRRWLVPIGPVAVFSASNFPLAFSVLGGDTASALAAGCPVVVKAHSGHPRLSDLVAGLATEVLPSGVLAVVHGREAGIRLVGHPDIAAVGFTGSVAGGRALFDLAAARPDPIPFYGELGSVNPVVVTPAASAARAGELISGFVNSFTLGNGQFCTKPGLLFLPRGHGWEDRLATAVAAVPAAPMLGPWICAGFAEARDRLAATAGVRLLAGDTKPRSGDDPTLTGPALFATSAADFAGNPAMADEAFGPAALVVEYASEQELKRVLATLPGSLTATLHADAAAEKALACRLLTLLSGKAGRVVWGGWPTGVAVAWATQHGGPWPAATPSTHTGVGVTAMRRFQRPVSFQGLPDELLPEALRDANPWHLARRVDGVPARPEPATAAGPR
ncbi:aldehyde dehydrogenase (NADP(+)) [Actinoplanes sp. NPDC049118]|uniref:aldehyde dehydrogenase (NADP(+)) n=1 Tax=Actinoplanes sp. NPDC049118 TaxID=3155769 RepID=UPI0033C00522